MDTIKMLYIGFLLLLAFEFSVVSASVLNSYKYPAIYNFGDSNSATGGFKLGPPGPPNAPNRICDGHLIIDFIAEYLKLPYLNAYDKSPELNFRFGANFARAGASIRKWNVDTAPSFLGEEIMHFREFKSHVGKLYNEAKNDSERATLPRQEDFAKALYVFDIGQNDLTTLLSMSLDQIRPIVTDVVDQFALSVKNIYEQGHGGKAFWIHNTGPAGCLPVNVIQHANLTRDQHGCIKSFNEVAIEFNKQLQETANKLRIELTGAAITYVDIYAAKYRLISNAKNLGFDDPFKFCCGDKENLFRVRCGQSKEGVYGSGCQEPSKFISWDGVHYTQAANKWVSNQILSV